MKIESLKRGRKWGFSLVEIALAVAIAAVGLVAIMGLIPQGLEMSRRTASLAAETRIMQQITGEVQAETWADQLTKFPVGTQVNRYYDDQGTSILDQDMSRLAYVARVEVPTPDVTMPGSPNSNAHPYLRRVVVKIADRADEHFVFDDAHKKRFSTHVIFLAKTR
jgi:uncharacterized protein (TIGR02598 family)